MTTRLDLIVRQGETWSLGYTKRDSAGAAVDLTGYTAQFKIAGYGEGSVDLGAAQGTITLSLTPAQTTALAEDGVTGFGAYADAMWGFSDGLTVDKRSLKPEPFQRAYTVYITSSIGTVSRELEGLCEIFRDVDV